MISAFGPWDCEVGIMRTFRVARLAWRIGHDGLVPIAQVDDLTVGSSSSLLECRPGCRVDRVPVTRSSKLAGSGDPLDRMPELYTMQSPPGPRLPVRSQSFFKFRQRNV